MLRSNIKWNQTKKESTINMLKFPEHKRLLPPLFLCPGGTERKKQWQKDRAHAENYLHSYGEPTRETTRFAWENSFLHVKEINSPNQHPQPPSLPHCRQRVLMAVQLCLLPKHIKRQPPWPGNAGGGVLPSCSHLNTHIDKGMQAPQGWLLTAPLCVLYVPAVSNISGSGCNCSEMSGPLFCHQSST